MLKPGRPWTRLGEPFKVNSQQSDSKSSVKVVHSLHCVHRVHTVHKNRLILSILSIACHAQGGLCPVSPALHPKEVRRLKFYVIISTVRFTMKVRMRFSSIPRQNGTLSVPSYPHLMQIEYFQSNYNHCLPQPSHIY